MLNEREQTRRLGSSYSDGSYRGTHKKRRSSEADQVSDERLVFMWHFASWDSSFRAGRRR